MDSVEVLNGTLMEGDRVAVAAKSRGPSMRVGKVLEILPGIAGYNQRNGPVRVRVLVEKSSGVAGLRRESDRDGKTAWRFSPFIQVYDDPSVMVKLGAVQDAL